MKSYFILATLAFAHALADPLLLRSFAENGLVTLQKADEKFMQALEATLEKATSLAPSQIHEKFSKLIEQAAQGAADGEQAAALLLTPLTDAQLLISPVKLSDAIFHQLAESGKAALEAFTTEGAFDISNTHLNVIPSLSTLTGIKAETIESGLANLLDALRPSEAFLQSTSLEALDPTKLGGKLIKEISEPMQRISELMPLQSLLSIGQISDASSHAETDVAKVEAEAPKAEKISEISKAEEISEASKVEESSETATDTSAERL